MFSKKILDSIVFGNNLKMMTHQGTAIGNILMLSTGNVEKQLMSFAPKMLIKLQEFHLL
jgi:hypothetical protein